MDFAPFTGLIFRLLTIKKENVEIVDIAKISARVELDTFISTPAFDSGPDLPKPSQIIISHVQSMAEETLPQLQGKPPHHIEVEPSAPDPTGSEEPDPLDLHEAPVIPNSTNKQITTYNSENQSEFALLPNHQHSIYESGSLGSLEGHLELVNLSESFRTESIAVEKIVEEQPTTTEAPDSSAKAAEEPNLPGKMQEACKESNRALLEEPELTGASQEEEALQETPLESMVISQSNSLALDDAASPKSVERIDKIEAELKECLASTSDLAPAKPMSLDDSEDFSKDIEFSTFITKNNYMDYDFVTDVVMEEKNDCQSHKVDEPQVPANKPEEAKPETFPDEDRLGNSEDFPGCAEDAQQFLADLDNDIIMDNVAEERPPDGPEKTLEMIVNDLNQSLGE